MWAPKCHQLPLNLRPAREVIERIATVFSNAILLVKTVRFRVTRITYFPIDAEDPVVAAREPDDEERAEYHLRESRRPRDENDAAWPATLLGVVIPPDWTGAATPGSQPPFSELEPPLPDLEPSLPARSRYSLNWSRH